MMHESCAADARDGGAQAGDTRPLRGGPLTDMEREQNGAHKAKPTEPRARDMLACPRHPEEKLGASEANRARNSRRQDVAEFWLEHGPRAHEYGRRCLHRWQGRAGGRTGRLAARPETRRRAAFYSSYPRLLASQKAYSEPRTVRPPYSCSYYGPTVRRLAKWYKYSCTYMSKYLLHVQ